jgi:hypothetical protein
MSDISVLIQGPLNKTSLECVKYYSTIGPVVICYWNTDDASLLNQYNLTDCILIRCPIPLSSLPYVHNTFMYQLYSIAYGLRNIDTAYVIRTRSDERYENLQPLIEKFNEDKLKVVCGNIFFKKWKVKKHHIGDHLFLGETKVLFEAYENMRQFAITYYKNGDPEQIAAKAIMEVLLKADVCLDDKELFKSIFDVIDINTLAPFIATWVHGEKTYVNVFSYFNTICTMEDL